MSQCEMLPVVEVCEEAAAYQRELERQAENQKWVNWGRVGLLTREQIKRMAQPKWMWDDYSI